MRHFKGFEIGDKVSVKIPSRIWYSHKKFSKGMVGKIAGFPPKVCKPKVCKPEIDGLDYFALVDCEENGKERRTGVDMSNLVKVVG